ncbi:MAG TPA: tetratricopeptide repeat protein [Anaerolineae bacterium]|nr:tetratricopeptide repeat protein [Anaerolineae bacterium]
MEEKSLPDQVDEALALIRKRNLEALGQCPLAQRFNSLLEERVKLHDDFPSPDSFGVALRDLVIDSIATMKPPGDPEDKDQVDWRHYLLLHFYIVRGQAWAEVAEDLGIGKTTFFNVKKLATQNLAAILRHIEQDAFAGPIEEPLQNLPHRDYRHFVERLDERSQDCVEWIIEQLATRSWIAVINGGPGVGKTTVAREVAQRCLERRLFGVIVWASAQPRVYYAPGTIAQPSGYVRSLDGILDAIGKTIGRRDVKETPTLTDKLRVVREILSSAPRSLVIIDNVEALTEQSQKEIFGFLWDLPTPHKSIITGRARDYPGQIRLTLPGMELPQALEFMRSEAETRVVPVLKEREAQRVYEVTGGFPLPMQQAIGLIAALDCGVDQAVAFGQIVEHKKLLEFMWEEAYQKLGRDEKMALHAMGIFLKPASPDAIRAATSLRPAHSELALGRLYRAFLVGKSGDRYDVLPVVGEYLEAVQLKDGILDEDEDLSLSRYLDQARRNVAHYYLDSLARQNLAERLDFLQDERRNILGLMEWCYGTQEYELLVELMQIMGQPLSIFGYFKDRISWAEKAIEVSEALGRPDLREWFTVHDLAWSYIRTGRTEEGKRLTEEALRFAQKHDCPRVEALALRNLGRFAGEEGDVEKGIEHLEASLDVWQRLVDREWIAPTQAALGFLRYRQRDLPEAEDCLRRALEGYRATGYTNGEISTLSELALIMAEQGDVNEALELSQRALDMGGALEEPAPPHAYALWLRAQLGDKLGESPERIAALAKQAVRTYENFGLRYWAEEARAWLEQWQQGLADRAAEAG